MTPEKTELTLASKEQPGSSTSRLGELTPRVSEMFGIADNGEKVIQEVAVRPEDSSPDPHYSVEIFAGKTSHKQSDTENIPYEELAENGFIDLIDENGFIDPNDENDFMHPIDGNGEIDHELYDGVPESFKPASYIKFTENPELPPRLQQKVKKEKHGARTMTYIEFCKTTGMFENVGFVNDEKKNQEIAEKAMLNDWGDLVTRKEEELGLLKEQNENQRFNLADTMSTLRAQLDEAEQESRRLQDDHERQEQDIREKIEQCKLQNSKSQEGLLTRETTMKDELQKMLVEEQEKMKQELEEEQIKLKEEQERMKKAREDQERMRQELAEEQAKVRKELEDAQQKIAEEQEKIRQQILEEKETKEETLKWKEGLEKENEKLREQLEKEQERIAEEQNSNEQGLALEQKKAREELEIEQANIREKMQKEEVALNEEWKEKKATNGALGDRTSEKIEANERTRFREGFRP